MYLLVRPPGFWTSARVHVIYHHSGLILIISYLYACLLSQVALSQECQLLTASNSNVLLPNLVMLKLALSTSNSYPLLTVAFQESCAISNTKITWPPVSKV